MRDAPKVGRVGIFVSFKDPEDLGIAELAERLLRRAGFDPYLSKRERRAGSRYWKKKIYPAIRSSIGAVAIWTNHTKANSRSVRRELAYSKRARVPVGLFLEKGIGPPRGFPRGEREHCYFDYGQPVIPFAEEITAATVRHRNGGKVFE